MSFQYDLKQLTHSNLHFIRYDDFDPDTYQHILTPLELERYFNFSSIYRKKEFVATRFLRHELFGFEHIHYDANGAPHLHHEGYISISHSPGIVGIAVNKDFRIGLDIELKSSKAQRVFTKFLSTQEQLIFDLADQDALTTAWSCKETLYKIAGKRHIDFRTDLALKPIGNGKFIGSVKMENTWWSTEIHTFVFECFIITLNEKELKLSKAP
jgi:4'-phosphopantetheinyl transferase